MILPDLDSLRCFVSAAERPSFRLAARQVALSPAAFSDRIRRLEEQLGVTLFRRTTRSVALSDSGARLLPQARRAIEEAARCAAVVRGRSVPLPFDLVLGTRYELGLSWLVPALDDLRRTRPERAIHLAFGDSPDLMERLARGQIDALVSSVRLTRGGLDYLPLHEERYVFVATPSLLRRHPIVRPSDARRHVLLDSGPDLPLFRYLRDSAPDAQDWPFLRIEILGTIAAVRQRALVGAGVCVLPRYFAAPDLRRHRLRVAMSNRSLLRDAFRLVWRRGDPRETEMRALGEELAARPIR